MRHPTRHPVLVALLVSAFALMAGCGGSDVSSLPIAEPPPSSSPTPVEPDVTVEGVEPEDLEVTEATGGAPGVNLSLASPIYSVTTDSPLAGPTNVRLLLDNALPRTVPIFVMSRETASDPWSYLPGRLMSDQRHVEVTTTHLSDFAVLVMDLEGALQSFQQDLKARLDFSINRKVEKPECGEPEEARKDGYSVTSTKARKTVFWCFGFENDQRVLRLVNRRVLPIQVAHPDAPEVPPTGKTPKAWLPWAGALGNKATFLPPGGTVTYDADLAPTKRALINAATDSTAQSMRALHAMTAALVIRNRGFGAGKVRTVDTVASLVARPQCSKALGLGADKMLGGCFSRRKVMDTFGSGGMLLARLTTDPTTKVFLRQQFTAIAQGVQHNGDQQILVRRAKPDFTKFAGSFSGEARSLVVNAVGLVYESANNVNRKEGTIERVADVTYQLSEPRTENGVSSAQAVLTKVKIYDRAAFRDSVPSVGDTGTFRIEKGQVRSPFVKRLYCGKGARQNACE